MTKKTETEVIANPAAVAAPEEYGAASIKVLKGIEAVRKRPGMYIGDTGSYGLHHLVREIVDNSVDEHLARDVKSPNGYCQNVQLTIHPNNSITVVDDGRGIPVDMHPTEHKPALEIALTVLHAGGKFDHASYKVSGGLHGVGLSVVNALSEWLEVEVYVNGQIYTQRYQRGEKATELQKLGPTNKRGTLIRFKPDTEMFGNLEFKYDLIASRLRDLAYLNAGLSMHIADERTAKIERFQFAGGLRDFVQFMNTNKELVHPDVVFMRSLDKDGQADGEIAFQYNDGYNDNVMSYANNINTPEGGTHLVGFRSALTRAVNSFARKNNLLKDEESPNGDDMREGLTAVVSVKVMDPQFEGQTKNKLGNSDVGKKVESVVYEQLSAYFEEHPATGKAVFNKAIMAQRARIAAKKAKELARRKSAMFGGSLPGKLADCQSREVDTTELYVVEGDSAGGSAKQCRDRRFQAILPLKGKILNVEKARLDKMLAHEEIQILITAIGTGIGTGSGDEDFDYAKLRYGKIIIMTDADVDGSHIRTLLLTFFFRHMRELIEKGHIYIAQPPLYKVTRKRHSEYVHSDREMKNTLVRLGMEDCRVNIRDGNREFKGEALLRLLELLEALEDFGPAIRRHGIHFERFLTLRNAEGKLPLLRAVHDKKEFFCYTDKEFNAQVAAYEKSQGRDAVVWESEEIAGDPEKADFRLYHIPEAIDLAARLRDLEALGFHPMEYAADIHDRFEVNFDKTVRVVSGIKDILEAVRKNGQEGIEIQRYKGLGEMNPEQLWETTMDPQKRTLLRVGLPDAASADWIFNVLMGELVEPRREYINKHALEVRNLDLV